MKKIFFNFLTSILIISCNKEDDLSSSDLVRYGDGSRTKVEGRVLEYGTNKPLYNAKVILREGTYSGIWPLNGSYENIDTVYSDQEGRYNFEFRHKVAERPGKADGITYLYEMDCNEDKYFGERGVPVGAGYWYKNKDLILDPYAWIKVHIKNVIPFDDFDEIRTNSDGGGGDYSGRNVDLYELHIGRGNIITSLSWYVIKNKMQTNHRDSIYLPAFDTLLYEILY